MFGKKKDSEDMSKNETSGRDSAADAPAPRTYTPRPEPLAAGRPGLSDAPRRLPDVAATPARRAEVRPEPPRTDVRPEPRAELRSDVREPRAGEGEAKKLIVGRGIVLTGEIRACDRLVVEGRVEATLADSRSIEIAESGLFKGSVQIDSAEISGRFEGDITVKHRLVVHSTGRVIGNIRYGQLEIERGGILSGTVELIDDVDQGYQGESMGRARSNGAVEAAN
ncbi:MAG: polymer-forming cytoskeletal protein [Dongiaceae bacterium]